MAFEQERPLIDPKYRNKIFSELFQTGAYGLSATLMGASAYYDFEQGRETLGTLLAIPTVGFLGSAALAGVRLNRAMRRERALAFDRLGLLAVVNDSFTASELLPDVEAAGLLEARALDNLGIVAGRVALQTEVEPVMSALKEVEGIDLVELEGQLRTQSE